MAVIAATGACTDAFVGILAIEQWLREIVGQLTRREPTLLHADSHDERGHVGAHGEFRVCHQVNVQAERA